jgi:DNA topoisomerase-1
MAASSPGAAAVDAAAVDAAVDAGLVRVADDAPGIRRRRAGAGFAYVGPTGRLVRDPKTLARVRALAIPPAWTDVWICPRADGHLQAVGRDAKGRKQYRYHAWFREARDAAKYARLLAMADRLPRIRAAVRAALAKRGLGRQRVTATVVRVLDVTGMRVGNLEYARTNGAFGLTTLRDGHVRLRGGEIRFRYRGKSGKERDVRVTDPALADVVRRCRDLPGDALFQWVDEHGTQHRLSSTDVNEWLRAVAGTEVTAKDFRTWTATVTCFEALRTLGPPSTAADAKRRIVAAIRWMAERLGNTAAVCRRSYVHPEVLAAYARRERLPGDPRRRGHGAGLRPVEVTVATWLRARSRRTRDRAAPHHAAA